jgi:hypothetical protein
MHTCLIQGNLILVLMMSNNIREGETHTHTHTHTHTLFLNIPRKEMSWSGCLWPLTAYLLYAARPSITPCAPFFNPSHTCHLHALIVKRQKSLISVLVGKVYSCFCSSCYKRDLMVIHGSDRQHIIPHSASLIFLAKTWIDYHSHSLWPSRASSSGC